MKSIFEEFGGVILIVVAIVLLIGFMTIFVAPGRPLSTVFNNIIHSFNSSNDVSNSKPAISVNALPENTTDDKITVSGTATDAAGIDAVTVILGEKTHEATIAGDGTWSVEVGLTEGDNIIVAKTINQYGNSATATAFIVASHGGPKLLIDELPDIATQNMFLVSGSVADESGVSSVDVFVGENKYSAAINADGSWSASVALAWGDNAVQVVAQDTLGNKTNIKDTIGAYKPDTFEVVNNKVIITNGEIIKDVLSLSVFYGVTGIVTDINDWDTVIAASSGYRTFTDVASIKKVVLTENDTYILRLRYNDANGNTKVLSIQRTVNSIIEPSLSLENYSVVAIDGNAAHTNHRLVIFQLGDKTVDDLNDWNALEAIDKNYKMHWGLAVINSVTITEPGNYVLWFVYNDTYGRKEWVAIQTTIE